MAVNSVDIKLLNGSKQEVSYTGVETITIPKAIGSGVETFTAGIPLDSSAVQITPDFTSGNMVVDAPSGYVVRDAMLLKPSGMESVIAKGESLMGVAGEYVTPGTTKSVSLDFSSGDMSIAASGDERWSQLDIFKPATLISENIPKGIEIAGVPGALEAISLQAIAERTISGEVSSNEVTTVGSYAFHRTQVAEVNLPNCTSVGLSAFTGCSLLSEVTLPMCSSLAEYVFSACSMLKTVTLGCDSNFFTRAGSYTFANCSTLEEIKFMYSGSFVDGALLIPCNKGSMTATFQNCSNLKSIHLIGKDSSYGGAPENGWTIGSYAFLECSNLSKVTITGILGAYRFPNNSGYISSASNAYEIGENAFRSCRKLSYLSLSINGSYGLFISDYAFSQCSTLQHLWLNFVTVPSMSSSWAFGLGTSVFYGTPFSSFRLTGTYGSIHVTKNAYLYLRNARGWSAYAARMVSY